MRCFLLSCRHLLLRVLGNVGGVGYVMMRRQHGTSGVFLKQYKHFSILHIHNGFIALKSPTAAENYKNITFDIEERCPYCQHMLHIGFSLLLCSCPCDVHTICMGIRCSSICESLQLRWVLSAKRRLLYDLPPMDMEVWCSYLA